MEDQYLRFQYGSHFRSGFNAEQRMLLGERTRVWNLLAHVSNEHTQKICKSLSASNPVFAKALHDVNVDDSVQNKIALRSLINGLRPQIKTLDTALNPQIYDVVSDSGIWWQNRDNLYSSFTRALRTNKNLLTPISTRHGQNSTGNFGFRFQKPVTIEDLESGRLSVRITRTGKFATIRMPIHANGFGKYIFGEWPFTWHRDLPENSTIRAINVIGKMIGAEWRLSVSILIQNSVEISHARENLCGIDVGWRLGHQGLRVATASINGQFHHLTLNHSWVSGIEYVASLDSILDASCELAWTQNKASVPFPGWLSAESLLMESKSETWRAWLSATANMRRERKNKLARLERERLDVYRKFASQLVKKCDVIHIEKLDLRKLLSAESKQGPQQKRQQKLASISSLHKCIEHACSRAGRIFKRVEAYQTTVRHHSCGHINKPSLDQLVTCKGCGEIYDQDTNAALNISIASSFNKKRGPIETF